MVVERAIAVRGGRISSFRRVTEARVQFGFPGIWRFEYAFHVPQWYRWTVFTSEQPHYYLWDGQTMRAAVGDRVVGIDASGRAPLRSHARWTAVTYLDALCDGTLPVRFVARRASDSDETTVVLRLEGDREDFELTFDRHLRLIEVVAPIDMPPFGPGRLTTRFFDFRLSGGYLMPYRTRYRFDGVTLCDEETISFTVNDDSLDLDTFRRPPNPDGVD